MAVGLGVVEGFYGRPWSFEARRRVIELLAETGLQTYAYAPKSDPSHRAKWWAPLEARELASFEDLASCARDKQVRFIYGIAPQRLFGGRSNLDIGQGGVNGDGFRALVARCGALADRGVDHFMVLFDDTWPTVAPRLATFEVGASHATVARELVNQLSSRYGRTVSVSLVPAIYAGRAVDLSRGALAYLRGLASCGPTPIAWTGPRIFSSFISEQEREAFERAAGTPVWVWNNAIANDWLPLTTGEGVGLTGRQRLAFGPIDNVAPEVFDAADGVLLNGAREVEVTRVALACFAEQRQLRRAYRSDDALGRAITRVFGPDAAGCVGLIQDIVRGHPLASPHITGARTFHGLAASASGLREYLNRLVDVAVLVEHSLHHHPGREELLPTARKAALAARALSLGLQRSPSARQIAREALAIPWATGLDDVLNQIDRGRWP